MESVLERHGHVLECVGTVQSSTLGDLKRTVVPENETHVDTAVGRRSIIREDSVRARSECFDSLRREQTELTVAVDDAATAADDDADDARGTSVQPTVLSNFTFGV